ncbi:MAG TPA: G1 family glutamic endopeptidase [Mycobacteriales bacterium]|nr:G1 family glutamic endopeptidase [Mycobacteriales bacterium]
MRRFTARSVVPAVVALATVLGGSGAAVAAAGSAVRAHSPIFAGFAVSKPTAHVKHVTSTFIVPTITCDSSFSGVGPSVLVYSNVNPKTAAHITSGAGLGVACENGNAIYESVMIVNDKPFNDLTLQAGDVVDVSVRVVPAGTTVTVDDTTADVSKTRTGHGHTGVQAFIGDNSVVVDGVSDSGKLDPFTPTQVSDVLINAHPLGSEKPIRYQWVRDGTTLVSAGPLVSREDFTLTFESS